MYLKSIKAYGFKSFADKIEINFEKNINGIVGPNGSGKSNVVDAVRWVLGEQSIKSLRGDTSTDVIFSGSKSRKPLNSASVTLTFDNQDFYLPLPYTEVSVRRVMYRSGENEYYLNQERCRLKDITNLLVDTGADKESFNIISQGKIDEILSTKPGDRRAVFESAAGVMKYKRRKEEATKKLERTNLNIQRVDDILNELENNLAPLEKQSKDAKRYLEIQDVLSELSISLIASDVTQFNYESGRLEEEITALKDEVVRLSNTHSSYDVDVMQKKDEVKKLDSRILEVQNTYVEVTRSIEKLDADIRLLKMKREYSDTDVSLEESKLLTLKEEVFQLNNRINEERNTILTLQSQLQGQKESLSLLREESQQLVTEKNRFDQMLEANQRKQRELKSQVEYLENSIEKHSTVPSAVRNILNHPRLKGAYDVVGNILTMDERYTVAIMTSLGGNIHYLVVDSSDHAREMVLYLKENQLGRATFLPLDTMKPRNIDQVTFSKLKEYDGFLGIASSLVKYEPIYENVVLNLLGNIVIVSNIDTAVKISRSILNRYKIVTLDGQVINVGGSITGGSKNEKNNVILEKYHLESNRLALQETLKKNEELLALMEKKNEEIQKKNIKANQVQQDIFSLEENIHLKQKGQALLKEQLQSKESDIRNASAVISENSDQELEKLLQLYYSAVASRDNLQCELNTSIESKKKLENDIQEIESLSRQDNANILTKEKHLKELEIKKNMLNVKLDNLLVTLGDEYNLTYDAAIKKYKLEMDVELAREKVKTLKKEVKEIGYVNVEAISLYQQGLERYEFLTSQREDLKKAEATLIEIMEEMDEIMKEKFSQTFEAIRVEFKKVFRQMFRGGEAELVLTDPDHLLETGIEIEAIPSGKNLKSITLLSGGEKTFTAISLLFAILNVRPVPFCLLDEVEAALDDANVESFGHYLNEYRDKTQFILITHKKKTMEFANTLYGITMQESGVSKLVSVRLEDIENDKH